MFLVFDICRLTVCVFLFSLYFSSSLLLQIKRYKKTVMCLLVCVDANCSWMFAWMWLISPCALVCRNADGVIRCVTAASVQCRSSVRYVLAIRRKTTVLSHVPAATTLTSRADGVFRVILSAPSVVASLQLTARPVSTWSCMMTLMLALPTRLWVTSVFTFAAAAALLDFRFCFLMATQC